MNNLYFYQEFNPTLDDQIINSLKTVVDVISFEKTKKENYLPWNFSTTADTLCIPTFFDAYNSFSYDGVEFALQWYLYNIQNNKQIQIILVGSESKAAFFEHCEYSFFIKCPNVCYIELSLEEIKQKLGSISQKTFDKTECISALKNIGIKPPTSYKTHHSIANEWCIYRWSKYLKIENSIQSQLSEEIRNSLYYNYLLTIYPITSIESQKDKILEQGKVLVIDDEIEKGWGDFFSELSTSNQFMSIGHNFKDLPQEEIINQTLAVIKLKEKPDVVILDLRLHDDDFDNKEIEGLTGIKILEEIKAINKGIQVIAFTASNKIWNYQAMQVKGIDGFILKESPELSQDKNFTPNAIQNIIVKVNECINMKFLKSAFSHLSIIKDRFLDFENYSEIESIINISFDLLNKSRENDKYINYAYLQLFLLIEAYLSNENIFIDGDSSYVVVNEDIICVQKYIDKKLHQPISHTSNGKYEIKAKTVEIKYPPKRLDTNYKVSALLIFRLGNSNSSVNEWTNIYTNRNTKAAHFDKKNSLTHINVADIEKLLNFILYLTDNKNINLANKDLGLKEPTINEMADAVNNKFGKLK